MPKSRRSVIPGESYPLASPFISMAEWNYLQDELWKESVCEVVQAEFIVANCQKRRKIARFSNIKVVLPCKHRKKKLSFHWHSISLPRSHTCCVAAFSLVLACEDIFINVHIFINFISQFEAFFTSVNTPVIVLNEFNKFFLTVGFSGDDDGFIHEGLVEVHLIQLQV